MARRMYKLNFPSDIQEPNIQEIASPDRSLTEEAMRVLRSSPKWTPGKQRNRAVRVAYILPIDFVLQQ